MLTAALSLVFSLLQSGSNTHYASHSSFTVYLTRLKFHRFIFVRSSMQEKIQNVLQRTSFRVHCTVTGLVLVILNYAFYFYEQIGKEKSTLGGIQHFIIFQKANLELIVPAWFCTRRVWILSPRYPSLICLCGLSEECLYSSLTLSTSRATSIFSCIWRIGEKKALVFLAIKREFHTFIRSFVLSFQLWWNSRERGREEIQFPLDQESMAYGFLHFTKFANKLRTMPSGGPRLIPHRGPEHRD